jgi:hypothetical protein
MRIFRSANAGDAQRLTEQQFSLNSDCEEKSFHQWQEESLEAKIWREEGRG